MNNHISVATHELANALHAEQNRRTITFKSHVALTQAIGDHVTVSHQFILVVPTLTVQGKKNFKASASRLFASAFPGRWLAWKLNVCKSTLLLESETVNTKGKMIVAPVVELTPANDGPATPAIPEASATPAIPEASATVEETATTATTATTVTTITPEASANELKEQGEALAREEMARDLHKAQARIKFLEELIMEKGSKKLQKAMNQ